MFLLSILTSQLFWLNWLLGILLIEYALYKCKPVIKIDEARDSKYPAFRRYDVKEWKRWRLYLIGGPIVFLRLVATVSIVIFYFIILKVLIVYKGPNRPQPQWMQNFIIPFSKLCTRIMTITAAGLFWYNYETVNLDYKPFLGPTWTP